MSNKNPKLQHSPKSPKEPKQQNLPSAQKKVSFGGNPDSCLNMKPSWQFHKRDKDHPNWGWNQLSSDEFVEILTEQLCNFESMTWDEILRASGGRNQGNNHHNIEIEKCCKDAQNRLMQLKLDDIDQLFSLRLTGRFRLWGIKEGQVLRFIWIDKEHTVYPSTR